MPKGFDYEAALERARQPARPSEEQLRRLYGEIVPVVQAEQIAQGSMSEDHETGRQLLRDVQINLERSQGLRDPDDYEGADKIIDEWLRKRQDRSDG